MSKKRRVYTFRKQQQKKKKSPAFDRQLLNEKYNQFNIGVCLLFNNPIHIYSAFYITEGGARGGMYRRLLIESFFSNLFERIIVLGAFPTVHSLFYLAFSILLS